MKIEIHTSCNIASIPHENVASTEFRKFNTTLLLLFLYAIKCLRSWLMINCSYKLTTKSITSLKIQMVMWQFFVNFCMIHEQMSFFHDDIKFLISLKLLIIWDTINFQEAIYYIYKSFKFFKNSKFTKI